LESRHPRNAHDYVDEFRKLLESLANLTNKYFPDAKAIPYVDENLLIFSGLPDSQRVKILRDTREYLHTFLTLEGESYDLNDERQYLWRVLKDRGLRLGSDVMDIVSERDVIEVYGADGIQLWFNLRLMEICSHSIETVLCQPWHERYRRSEFIQECCLKEAQRVLESEESAVINPQVPAHIVEEIDSTLGLRVLLEHKKLAPVFNRKSKEKVGFIVTSQAKIIGAKRNEPIGAGDTLYVEVRGEGD
jgi:hypothetical protein